MIRIIQKEKINDSFAAKKLNILGEKFDRNLDVFGQNLEERMSKKRSAIKLSPASLIITLLLSWGTYISVREILSEYGL